ncbi:MAG: substrate-binding domain-containing protein, partial [Pseudomonadota bacterium]
EADPARVSDAQSAAASLTRIAEATALFASRGDESGTHKAELAIWASTAIDPQDASGRWYRETGSGMGATLNTAVALGAYALTDRASWLTFGNKQDFAILFQGDPALFNQYALLPATRRQAPEAVARLEDWLTGPGQSVIAAYTLEGEALFIPNAAVSED